MQVNFDKETGLVPCVVQQEDTKEVLMLAYMNQESLDYTIKHRLGCFYSRSRKCLWVKGESSNNYLHVKDILIDCDEDTILLMVAPVKAACHTGNHSCFYRRLENEGTK